MDNHTLALEITEVQQLHNTALESLPQHSDIKFPQFSKLPIELRQNIWKLACLVPRIHIIKTPVEGHRIALQPYNRSRTNPIMNTCGEARAVVLSLQLNYFYTHEHFTESAPSVTTSRANRFTDELDTFWLAHEPNDDHWVHEDDSESFPRSIHDTASWHCGRCHRPKAWDNGCGTDCFGSKKDIPLRSIAINLADWVLTDQGLHDEFWDVWGSLGIAYLHNVKEILIVVERFGSFVHERDPIFLSPSEKDRRILLETIGNEETMFYRAAEEANWINSAKYVESQLRSFRKDRMTEREGLMEDAPGMLADKERYPDISEWKVPTIKFVEARKGSDRRLLLS